MAEMGWEMVQVAVVGKVWMALIAVASVEARVEDVEVEKVGTRERDIAGGTTPPRPMMVNRGICTGLVLYHWPKT